MTPFLSYYPLYFFYLCAGSVLFSFHFLILLTTLCQKYNLSIDSFCYVLTDFAPKNLEYWRHHPNLQPYFNSGLLDIALFDVNSSSELDLQVSQRKIKPRSLMRPLVIVANYLFDSIPQELFYFENGNGFQVLVSLPKSAKLPANNEAVLPKTNIRHSYRLKEMAQPFYSEPYLQQIIDDYQQTISDAYILFPAVGLRCLQRMRALSSKGILLLTADKGSLLLEEVQ